MTLNSRGLGLLLAASIAIITTAFLSLLPDISPTALGITFILSFSTSYILVRFMAEFLFFKEIRNIYDALENLQDYSFTHLKNKPKMYFNPLSRINKSINVYAAQKEKEIEELKKMETFRREFIADISHELKTPIFAAQGFVHTLLDGAVEDKKVRSKFLKKAAKSLDGLDILVQELLTISQMETGEIKMHLENFDIVELCREVFDQLENKAEKKNIKVAFKEDYNQPIYVEADFQRIYQVLTNLISNALKYTSKGGQVTIAMAEKNEGKIEISVEDNGKGIPEEDIARIFERFYRVDKSRSKQKGGTGLGLSIVKHILEAHKSRINVESKQKVGSRFWFELNKGVPAEKIEWELEDDD